MSFSCRFRCFLPAAFAAAILLLPPIGLAQVTQTQSSVEWLVAQSDTIVRGTVVAHTPVPLPDQRGWNRVTVQVEETILGAPSSKEEFTTWSCTLSDEIAGWQSSRQQLIFFLTRNKQRKEDFTRDTKAASLPTNLVSAACPYAIELTKAKKETSVQRSRPPFFSLDLTLLKTPDDILKAVHNAVRDQRAKPAQRSHSVEISHFMAELTGPSADINLVKVPIDKRLKKAARRWITNPDELLQPVNFKLAKDKAELDEWKNWERSFMRMHGIRALRYFKSDENVALLRGLLSDPSTEGEFPDDDLAPLKNVYFIRREAYKVLKEWRTDVAQPVLYK